MAAINQEYPPKADLRRQLYKPLPFIPPGTVDPALDAAEATKQGTSIILKMNAALKDGNEELLEQCFFKGQAYWRDILALTSHLRTFATPRVIARALIETHKLRGFAEGLELQGQAKFVPASPVLVRLLLSPWKSLDNPARLSELQECFELL